MALQICYENTMPRMDIHRNFLIITLWNDLLGMLMETQMRRLTGSDLSHMLKLEPCWKTSGNSPSDGGHISSSSGNSPSDV